MNIREALILQSSSLALQRAAADEIAVLDSHIRAVENELELLRTELAASKVLASTQVAEISALKIRLQNQKQ